jgi:hypothetical protein
MQAAVSVLAKKELILLVKDHRPDRHLVIGSDDCGRRALHPERKVSPNPEENFFHPVLFAVIPLQENKSYHDKHQFVAAFRTT